MTYIEKEKLMELSQDITTFNYETKSFGCFSGVSDDDIAKMPIADVVEVVRCKNCKRCYEKRTNLNNQLMRFCMRMDGNEYQVNANDFCSYGTPKERGGEK